MKTILKKLLKSFAALFAALLVIFVVGVLWPLPLPEPNPAPARLLIKDVNLVDVEQGSITPGVDIFIEHGEIISLGHNLDIPDATVIPGTGQYAIPGLFDMHVHSIRLSPLLTHPMWVAAGVTAVRDMGGCLGDRDPWVACAEDKRAWNQAVAEQAMVGPRFDAITSLAIDGGREIPGGFDRALGGAKPEGARARVAHDAGRGIDFLKPYTRIPREGYLALAEAAAEHDLYLAGHQPFEVSGMELVETGQRSVEHAFLFIWECYPGMEEIRSQGDLARAFSLEYRDIMIREHDQHRCAELRRAMADSGTAFVPTHTTRKLDAYALDEAYRNDPRLRYIPGPLRFMWLEDANAMAGRAGAGGQGAYMQTYRFGLKQTGLAHAAGVVVLAGTDAPDSFAFPGSGLHDELAHLVEAGLSNFEALRAATLAPAKFLGLERRAGVIAPGARADMVLLRRNPLDDISAVRDIDTVILAGSVYGFDDIERLKSGVEAAAGHWSMWPKFAWQMIASPVMRRQLID